MRITVEQLRAAFPHLEQDGSTIRSYGAQHGAIFVGRQQAGEEAPYSLEEMREIAEVLKGIGLDDRETIEPEYKRALGETSSQDDAWKLAAVRCKDNYFTKNGQSDNKDLVRRAGQAINTLAGFLSDINRIEHRLQFVKHKEYVEFGGEKLQVAGVCPFVGPSLNILKVAFELMDRDVHLPTRQAATTLQFFLNNPRSHLQKRP